VESRSPGVPATTEPISTSREIYVDFLRAFSLIVVVVFHWTFTIVVFSPTSVGVNNPIGSTPGAWLLTWVLQVMPLFFFVGGYAHWIVWKKTVGRGGGWWAFVAGRLRRLILPAGAVVVVWILIALLIGIFQDIEWMRQAVQLIISPLWFLGIYSVLVLIAPTAIWAHRRWGPLVLVFLVGSAAVLDVLRFHNGYDWAGYVNFLVVWGFCHQMGLLYRPLIEAPRQVGWMFFWSGVFALVALTNFGLYPRSMVGVPGDRFSNMGPPTLVITALVLLQVGVALLLRPWVVDRLHTSRRWAGFNELANRFSLPLYLFHSSGFAAALTFVYLVAGYVPPDVANTEWWAQRLLWLVLPALFTSPILAVFARRLTPKQRAEPVVPVGPEAGNSERFW